MLLTLSAKSFQKEIQSRRSGSMSLTDLPKHAHHELGLNGLIIQTSLLAGWDTKEIERLRDAADKAACPCLMLVEDREHVIESLDDPKFAEIEDRMERVLRVAHRLGCAGVAISAVVSNKPDAIDEAAEALKNIVTRAERLELNLLLASCKGVASTPEGVTSLIRKIGGFRIGSYPEFSEATKSPDRDSFLRSLAPYASAISATATGAGANGKGIDVASCLRAIRAVGYDGTLAIEFVGSGDPTEGVAQTRTIVEGVLEEPAV